MLNLPRLSDVCGWTSDMVEWGTDRELDWPLIELSRIAENSDVKPTKPLPRGAPKIYENKQTICYRLITIIPGITLGGFPRRGFSARDCCKEK